MDSRGSVYFLRGGEAIRGAESCGPCADSVSRTFQAAWRLASDEPNCVARIREARESFFLSPVLDVRSNVHLRCVRHSSL